jgi:putative transposase
MPWQEQSPMDLRVQFIADWQTDAWTMTELCADYGLSRKTGHKWVERYEAEGARGLHDRSRRPHTSPHVIDRDTIDQLVALRHRHPHWGAKKLLALARRREPERAWPSRSAVCDHLRRAGLIAPRRRRVGMVPRPPSALTVPSEPNQVWTTDYKGEFRTRDGRYCYPFTLRDGCTRFLLRCDARLGTTYAVTRRSFERAFGEYGLPECIRSDNGAPFARPGLGHLSQLAVWWMRLAIRPERIAPGHPEQNGSHEHFHGVLKADTTRPPAAHCQAQDRRFARFRTEYNHERPHEALGDATPASLYTRSPRRLPARLPPLDYDAHLEVRRVSQNGCIRWRGAVVFVSAALAWERIGFEEVDDGVWTVRFGQLALARFDERRHRIQPIATITQGALGGKPPRA